jgi:branched-chain amino acid aminotransferase
MVMPAELGQNGNADRTTPEYIWTEGELVPFEQATVHVLSPTLHYGVGVIEGIRAYSTARGPAVFRLQEHMHRFLNSARSLGFSPDALGYDQEELRVAVHRVVHANRLNDCYIRPILYLSGPLQLILDRHRPVVSIAAWKWGSLMGSDAIEMGIRAMVSSYTRLHPNANLTKSKITGQYANAVQSRTLAARAGFDEAIMLDAEGYVTAGTTQNLFIVMDDELYTSPGDSYVEGITRDSVMKLANDLGYKVTRRKLARDMLYAADEVFICGTATEVVSVREIDFRMVGNGRVGNVTRRLQQLYYETVRGRGLRSAEWLDYVVGESVL